MSSVAVHVAPKETGWGFWSQLLGYSEELNCDIYLKKQQMYLSVIYLQLKYTTWRVTNSDNSILF